MDDRLLNKVNTPEDLKRLPEDRLNALCGEIRSFLINTISRTGGHLASNLGVVELTVAIHRVFDLPQDQLVFDVGHQCYTHKLLTGRRERFDTLRSADGISGFPRPWESEYDSFIAGHSSTSISAAYGIAEAFAMQGKENYAIAVIGDGALTGGEAYEAMNNAGRSKTRLVVILNHNDMSISKNVGAFARYLSSMRSKPGYLKLKRRVERVLDHTPVVGSPVKSWLERSKSAIKTVLYRYTFFEEMGFRYLGPIDGHNLTELSRALSRAKELAAPVIIQVETTKGKGYPYAEQNPGAYHAISGFDVLNGGDDVTMSDCYSNQLGIELSKLADEDSRLCAITAAMKYGTGLHNFCAAHKDRFFDVGIAEPHAVTFAGGLASQGMLPVFCVYSTFLQRSYDQVIHDLAIDKKRVVLCVDRAGIVGEDGETHQGVFDAAYLSGIPGVTVFSPEGYEELRLCLREAVQRTEGVACVRYPRGGDERTHDLPPTVTSHFTDSGDRRLLVISYGRIFSSCWESVRDAGGGASLLKLTRIAPLEEAVYEAAMKFERILFVEEGVRDGGIGEHFASHLLERGFQGRLSIRAIEGRFVEQGTVSVILARLGLDTGSLTETIRRELEIDAK